MKSDLEEVCQYITYYGTNTTSIFKLGRNKNDAYQGS